MGYGTVLIIILIMTNVMLYFYGVDIPLNTLFVCTTNSTGCIGGQQIGSGTATQPSGETTGGLNSPNSIYQIILIIGAAVTATVIISIGANVLSGGNYTSYFTIPLAMFSVLVMSFMITPMGSIIGSISNTQNNMFCYNTRTDVMMFNISRPSLCMPTEIHILLIVFFGLLTVVSMMTYVGGRDW